MKKENLKTFIHKTNSGYKLEDLYNIQNSKVTNAEFIKNEIKENKKNQYIYFVLFLTAFVLIYLVIF